MAFRRDSERLLNWRRWLDKHRDILVALGLPDFVYGNERRWTCFLQEGGIDWESRWDVSMLTPNQAERFFDFVLREYGPDQHRCCLRALESVRQAKPSDGA